MMAVKILKKVILGQSISLINPTLSIYVFIFFLFHIVPKYKPLSSYYHEKDNSFNRFMFRIGFHKIYRGTGRPRAIRGQRFPLPCFA